MRKEILGQSDRNPNVAKYGTGDNGDKDNSIGDDLFL